MALTQTIKPAPYDWKYVLQIWHDKLGRSGLSIHAIATICKRNPWDILEEMKADETPGVDAYICGRAWDSEAYGMGFPALRSNLFQKNISRTIEDIERSLKEYPWPEYQGFRKWKGEKKVSFEAYHYGKHKDLTPKDIRVNAQGLAKSEGNRIQWGTGRIRKIKI